MDGGGIIVVVVVVVVAGAGNADRREIQIRWLRSNWLAKSHHALLARQ